MRPIDADELKKAIELFCEDERTNMTAIAYFALLELVDTMPTVEAEPVNGWISVEDKMPEFNQKVLVVYNDTDYRNGISIRRLIIAELAEDGYWMEGCTWHPDTSITHWMPLPEPPKEDSYDCYNSR